MDYRKNKMSEKIKILPLNAKSFEGFGSVVEREGAMKLEFNDGAAHRYHDLATIEALGEKGRPIISIASSEPKPLPLELFKVERHPLGSQAFIPLSDTPFLIVVAKDNNGTPDKPQAFISNGRQGINYNANTWHGVLTPLEKRSEFLVVDREGEGNNCEEFMYDHSYLLVQA